MGQIGHILTLSSITVQDLNQEWPRLCPDHHRSGNLYGLRRRTPPDGPPRVTAFSLPTITPPPIVIISSRERSGTSTRQAADAAVYGK